MQQLSDGRHDACSLFRHLPIGEANDPIALNGQLGITRAVCLERRATAVELVAIGLHDQAPFPPKEVDQEAPGPSVYLGCRKAMPATKAEKGSLQSASGGCLVGQRADVK